MTFIVNENYTRREINEKVGGDLQSYLPQFDKKIVCGCFGRRLNPKAPIEVLVGDLPLVQIRAGMLLSQGGSIPVFMKRAPKEGGGWQYKGRFRVKAHSTDRELLRVKQREAGRSDLPVMILYFERVSD